MEKTKMSLTTKTFIGFGIGIILGLVLGEKASVIKPLGTIFLNMIKMIVVPMVFCSITAGVASLGDITKLRIIDMADTTFNVTGDVVSTLCVARSEDMFVREPGEAA